MAYTRVTEEERKPIYHSRSDDISLREIARCLGWTASSICRELMRNLGRCGYRPKQAHEKAQAQAKRPGPRRFTDKVRADAKEVGNLWRNLQRARRKRRRRCPHQEGRGRGRIPNQRIIDTRPTEMKTRKTVGHWKGDLINGAHDTGNLVTLVERNMRYTLIGRTESKKTEEVTHESSTRFETLPQAARLSLTLDNGKEFARHEDIALNTHMDVFFTRPYHSWERGTNENMDGLIRRLYPKKSSFAEIGGAELKWIDKYLNDRPRKYLGWMKPREKMAALLGFAP